MPNSYFQFKQFTVQQENCAMKVCTDACLFGAWVASQMQNGKSRIENILDIGAGTGLLSIMLAQKTSAHIDAVEIDNDASQQAIENFDSSPWRDQLHLNHTSIQQFNQSTNQQYDLIISNPPFFQASLKSNNEQKNQAKHTNELSYEELAAIVVHKLKPNGKFYLLLPPEEFNTFNNIAKANNLFLINRVNVRQTERHNYFRSMGIFSKQTSSHVATQEITIKIDNEYSNEFIQLLKDYYLHL